MLGVVADTIVGECAGQGGISHGLRAEPLFCCQFEMLQHYIKDDNVMVLPLRMEDFPEPTHI